ncbi:MAG: non-hydrolyzing UDP-N-acetylglucosamine 2-epimerase [Dehalococcoidia bacterium]
MRIVSIVGARPQFIKLAALVRALEQRDSLGMDRPSHMIVHTGQHYDDEMSHAFFRHLSLPDPDFQLGVGSGLHGFQTGRMLEQVEEVLSQVTSDVVIVYGDCNSALAGALAAAKLQIPVAHVEAGLRSHNRAMPEEINRVLTDHASQVLFCPSDTAVANLSREGFQNVANAGCLIKRESTGCIVNPPAVINVGDVMYDVLLAGLGVAGQRSDILERLSLEQKGYYLGTVHRAENTDDLERLGSILAALDRLSSEMPVVVPIHPRTRGAIEKLRNQSASLASGLRLIPPIGYYDMLWLEKHARAILTDSGGMQKEAYWLGVPCFTLREETEWPETVATGANILTGTESERIVEAVSTEALPMDEKLHRKFNHCKSPIYGDGHAAQRILGVLLNGQWK